MLELREMRSTPSLPLLPSSLWPGVVAPDRVLSMGQRELNCILMLNWIVWNRSVLTFNWTVLTFNCFRGWLTRKGLICSKTKQPTQSGATTPSQSEPGSDGNKEVLRIPQSFSITGTSQSDCLVSNLGYSLAEGFIPFCRDAVSVFSSPSRLGHSVMELWGVWNTLYLSLLLCPL